jgi:hypothetical protein
VPEIGTPGQREVVEFDCWSSTRSKLPLSAREEKGDPCFTCSVRPLAAVEREGLASRYKTRVLAGWRVRVTVSERASESELLELGPLRRRVLLTGEKEWEPGEIVLTGLVRGEVRLPEGSAGQIDLRTFAATRGAVKTVPLTTETAGTGLRLVSWSPDYLEVRLAKGPAEGRRWDLTVRVPPGRVAGPLPADSAVILLTEGERPRRVRVPVTGIATQ